MSETPRGMPAPPYLLAYSNDQQAVADLRHWQDVARELPFYKRGEKAEARANADTARERCLAAGVNWELVPRPPADFKAPDRSGRPLIGAARVPDPATVPSPALGLTGRARTAASAGGAMGGAAAGFAAGIAGAAAWQWMHSADPVHVAADGSHVFQAEDGSFWLADAGGGVFGLTESGGWLAGDGDGMLWALSDSGQYVTWTADGTMVSLADNGSLVAYTEQGDLLTLGEDGSFYFAGADGDFYTMGADGSFYGVDETGSYFAAPEGSGLSGTELAAFDADFGGGDDGGFWDAF